VLVADRPDVRVLDHNLVDLAPPLVDYRLTVVRSWLRPSSYELSVPDTLDADTLRALLPRTNIDGDIINPGGSTYLVIDGRPYLTLDYPAWESDQHQWTLKGADAAMLDHRLVEHFPPGEGWYVTVGSAAERMRTIVQSQVAAAPVVANRVPHLSAPTVVPAGLTGRTEARYQTVSDVLETIGWYGGVGWDVLFHIAEGGARSLRWVPLPGRNLTSQVTFSLDLGTALRLAYQYDQREAATRVVLAAQGEGADRTIHVVGGGSGLFRRTTFRDARDVSDESDDPVALLESRGRETLAERNPGALFLVTPNTAVEGAQYLVDWDLGDVVAVVNPVTSTTHAARVVEVTVTVRSGLPEVQVAFDRPFPSLTVTRWSEPSFARS
jgi:hypothetical protein